MDSELDIAQVLHAEAQDVYLRAVVAKFRGCLDEWKRLMREAAALDCTAAGCAEDAADHPWRTRFLQHAAQKYLACDCHREAHALTTTALAGNPPASIYVQLLYLLDATLAHERT